MKTKITMLIAFLALSFSSSATVYTLPNSGAWSSFTSFFANVQDYDIVRIPAGKTLGIDGNACDDLENLDIIIEVYGTLNFDGNGSTDNFLYLSSGSSILLYAYGSVTASTCNGKKRIYFGGNLISTCNGGSAGTTGYTYASFNDINSARGIGANGPVPVTWLDYNVVNINGGAEISWATASEKNNSHFEIEFSADGKDWIFIDQMTSAAIGGNSDQILNYSYQHFTTYSARDIYYRIKQVDFDGNFEYTDVMVLNIENNPSIAIASKGNGVITLINQQSVGAELSTRILDLSGNEISSFSFTDSKEVQLDKSGLYIIEVRKLNEIEVVKHFVL